MNGLVKKNWKKVKNKIEAELVFSETNVLNKAMNLAFAELLGDASLVNEEIERYREVTAEDIKRISIKILTENQ